MDKRIEDFIYNIENGYVKSINEKNLPFEDLFIEYKEGTTVLDTALDNNVHIHIDYQRKMGSYPQAIIAFLKRKKYINSFNITEDALFTQIDGHYVLEYIKKYDQMYSFDISVVINHLEVIDVLIKRSALYFVGKLNPLLVDKLFELDSNGNFFIEKYVSNKDAFEKLIGVTTNPLIIGICKKHNLTNLLKNVNVDLLLKVDGNGKTYLETFLNDGVRLERVQSIPRNKEFVLKLMELERYGELSKATSEDVMLFKVNEEDTLLEYLIKNNKIEKLNFDIHNKEILQLISKYNAFNIIDGVSKSLLDIPTYDVLSDYPQETKPLYQFLVLDKNAGNPFPSFTDKTEEQIKFLNSIGRYDLLTDGVYNFLLLDLGEGKLLIDILMEKNVELDVKYKQVDPLVMARILDRKNYDFLFKFSNEMLLNVANDGITYFEHLLMAVKRREFKFNIHEEVDYEFDINKKCRLFTLVAKHDLLNHLNHIKKEDLLKEIDGKTFLEHLLDVDPLITVEKVIPKDLKSNMKVVAILQERGINVSKYDTPLVEEKGYNEEYLNYNQNRIGIGPLMSEGDALLNRLNDLFMNDGTSDKKLVEALISGYREALLVHYDITVAELRSFVQVKEENKDKFFYKTCDDGCYFRPTDGCIYCEDKVISTILHETGHALHHYLTDSKVPENYSEVLKSAKDNYVNLEAVEKFANEYHEIIDRLREEIDVTYKEYFNNYYDDEKRKEIEEFLNSSKDKKREEYKKLGISDKSIDIIISKAFTVDEYIEHQERVFKEEYMEARLRSEYNVYMVTGDVLDAIFGGELHSRELLNANGDKIKGTCGHGIAYYGSYSHGFDEMVANFASIIKSRTAKEDLIFLKELVGEEVFDMISNFYYTNISKSEALDLGEGPKL